MIGGNSCSSCVGSAANTWWFAIVIYVGAPLLVIFVAWLTVQIRGLVKDSRRVHTAVLGRPADPEANDPGVQSVNERISGLKTEVDNRGERIIGIEEGQKEIAAHLEVQDATLAALSTEVLHNHEGKSLRESLSEQIAEVREGQTTLLATVEAGISDRAQEWSEWRDTVQVELDRRGALIIPGVARIEKLEKAEAARRRREAAAKKAPVVKKAAARKRTRG